jgi:hypothetical protein
VRRCRCFFAADQRSLRAVAFSRQLQNLDHYLVLDIPRAATSSKGDRVRVFVPNL